MKTRRWARAVEKGRVEERRDQAEGLVSRIIVRREGAGSEGTVSGFLRGWRGRTDRLRSCCSDRSHRGCP